MSYNIKILHTTDEKYKQYTASFDKETNELKIYLKQKGIYKIFNIEKIVEIQPNKVYKYCTANYLILGKIV